MKTSAWMPFWSRQWLRDDNYRFLHRFHISYHQTSETDDRHNRVLTADDWPFLVIIKRYCENENCAHWDKPKFHSEQQQRRLNKAKLEIHLGHLKKSFIIEEAKKRCRWKMSALCGASDKVKATIDISSSITASWWRALETWELAISGFVDPTDRWEKSNEIVKTCEFWQRRVLFGGVACKSCRACLDVFFFVATIWWFPLKH